MSKSVPVYFYYLNKRFTRDAPGTTPHPMSEFISDFKSMMDNIIAKDLLHRKYEFFKDEKVIWLDNFTEQGDGNFDLVFKSAKYNHIRTVIDTNSMQERGTIKNRGDGDEEKTHLCIRFAPGQDHLICIHESNYYGMAIGRILLYLNDALKKYKEDTDSSITWTMDKEIMACDNFLEELRKMKQVSVLTVTVERQAMENDFLRVAGRNDIRDTIDIGIGKTKRNKYIPKNLVQEYYGDMQNDHRIKRIIAQGSNSAGPFKLDTELIKMKQKIDVETETITNEVISADFFAQAQILINTMR